MSDDIKVCRAMLCDVECRSDDADGALSTVTGYAAVYNSPVVIAGMFREQVAPGAFDGVIADKRTTALFNHDPNIILGNQSGGTLTLESDDHGLRYTVDVDRESMWGREVLRYLQRGSVVGSSFGFMLDEDGQSITYPDGPHGLRLRTITRVSQLPDVSPVTFPAYESTTAEARSQAAAWMASVPFVGCVDTRRRRLALREHESA